MHSGQHNVDLKAAFDNVVPYSALWQLLSSLGFPAKTLSLFLFVFSLAISLPPAKNQQQLANLPVL